MKFGLLGRSLKHSKSKDIHKRMGDYSYDYIEAEPSEVESFIKDNDYDGFNVTIPYKRDAFSLCDHLSEIPQRTGSVNTVIYDGSISTGYNTDYYGFIYACMRAGIKIKEKKVAILGSGGTSSTLKSALYDMGASSVTIFSRKGEITYESIKRDNERYKDIQVIINTTPVGMYPDNYNSVIDIEDFPGCEAVFDVIYNPLKTKLIRDAEKKGLIYTNGFPMLVAQAYYAKEILFGNSNVIKGDFTIEINGEIEKIINEMSRELVNIILIGMSGSGKSHNGRLVAKMTGRKFTDTDYEIVKSAKMDIAKIFQKYGEEYFRDIESEIIAEVGKSTGTVISSGGGAVLREENVDNLRQNGILVWIFRDIDNLGQEDIRKRPLLKDKDAALRLFEQRRHIYEKASNFQVDNTGHDIITSKEIIQRSYDFSKEMING